MTCWREEAAECAEAAMEELPEIQRMAFEAVVGRGMSYEEAARAMGCSVGTAKSRVFTARRFIRRKMGVEGS